MTGCLRPIRRTQRFHDLFDVLYPMPGTDHYRISRLDYHQILDTQRSDQATLTAHIVIAGIVHQHIALADVAIVIWRADLPQRRPGAHVTPTAVEGGYAPSVGMFHHRIINAVCGAHQKCRSIGADEIKISLCFGHGLLAGREHCRLMLTQDLEITIGPKQKQAAIPIIRAVGHIARRGGLIGLLDEFCEIKNAVGQCLTTAHVAITGLGATGDDTKGHQFAGLCGCRSSLYGCPKRGRIRHVMISGQYQQ